MHFQIYRWYVEIVYCFSLGAPFQPPQNPPGCANSPETPFQSCPQHPSRGRRGGGRGRKSFTLAVEYNMHVTWEGRGVEMYIQTPEVRGPPARRHEEGVHLPPGREGGSEATSGWHMPRERGTAATPAPVLPTETGGGAG